MQFRVLGPVEIVSGDQVLTPPRRRERCLLAMLLLEVNRAIPAERLADLLWEGRTPKGARDTLRSHVSRVRALLAAAGASAAGIAVTSSSGGYRMTAEPDMVDAHRFRTLVEDAKAITDPDECIRRLRTALDLWRGPALDNAASDWLRGRLCADLEERRLIATEELTSRCLAAGRESEILPELAAAAGSHPGRERIAELYMRALHQAGRRTEALASFERTRTFLARELGLDPGTGLRELHQAMLRDELPRPVPASPGRPVPVPRQLPADPAGFVGRDHYLSQLDAWLASQGDPQPTAVAIAAITGAAGVGKTALAVHWAHQVREEFPDGQLYVNLRGFDAAQPPMAPAQAIRGFLDALHVPPGRIPGDLDAQTALYRSQLADRRMLVVLDNARDSTQVRPLLPGTAGCLAVVTSRNRLSSLVAAEAAHPLSVDLLSHSEARRLLERRLDAGRLAVEPDAADEIVTRCSRLPLALAVAAARAATSPESPLRDLARELRETRRGLDPWSGLDPKVDVRAAFEVSCRTLTTAAARLLRLLGLHPGPEISIPAAASLADIPPEQARSLLAELTRSYLASEHLPGRYSLHDLLGAYTAELARDYDTEAARHAATRRLLDFHLHTARAAAKLLNPHRALTTVDYPDTWAAPQDFADREEALAWLTREQPVLLAVTTLAADFGLDIHSWQLAWTLSEFVRGQGWSPTWLEAQYTALDAARRRSDPHGQALIHRVLGGSHVHQQSYGHAHTHLIQALDHFQTLGDMVGQARTRLDIGVVLDRQGRHREALGQAQHALDLYRTEGDLTGQAYAHNGIGWLRAQLGEHQQALVSCEQALGLQHQIGDRTGEAGTWDTVGYCHHHLAHYDRAVACYQRALELVRRSVNRYEEAHVLAHLGDAHHAAGRPGAAGQVWQQALTILQELDHPDADQIRAKLGELGQTR